MRTNKHEKKREKSVYVWEPSITSRATKNRYKTTGQSANQQRTGNSPTHIFGSIGWSVGSKAATAPLLPTKRRRTTTTTTSSITAMSGSHVLYFFFFPLAVVDRVDVLGVPWLADPAVWILEARTVRRTPAATRFMESIVSKRTYRGL